MNEGAAHLVDRVLGGTPMRHWVLSLPHPLRYILAYDSELCTEVLGAFAKSVFRWLRSGRASRGLSSFPISHEVAPQPARFQGASMTHRCFANDMPGAKLGFDSGVCAHCDAVHGVWRAWLASCQEDGKRREA